MEKHPEVEKFLKSAKQWKAEMLELRSVLEKTKLREDFKWRLPCYTYGDDRNVVIVQPFKACLALMFFKGALLKDAKGILVENGPNSQVTRRLEMRSVGDVAKLAATIKAYVKEAIQIEESGEEVKVEKKSTPMPDELKKVFAKMPKVKAAFGELTPGRQRAYLLHFSSAKQSATRLSRIEKCIPDILKGRGLNDR